MRDAPTYATALHEGVAGNDPLGLGTQSERLYDVVFPGINNVVRYIRVYSVLCWTVMQVEQDGNGDSFRQARERMELLLLWMNPNRGLAGERRRRRFPEEGSNRVVTLTFEAFGSNKATLFQAAQYRPSLTNGLSFLVQTSRTQMQCSEPLGQNLANAFDKAARANPKAYRWLRSFDKLTARRSAVVALATALNVDRPSQDEQQAFLASFYPLTQPRENEASRNRWNSLRLMLQAVHAVSETSKANTGRKEATLREIRTCMARGLAPVGARTIVDADTQEVQGVWAVLQLWHLQRLCLESLSYLVEKWLALHSTDGDLLTVAGCAEALAKAAEPFHRAKTETTHVADTLDYFKSLQKGQPSLYAAAARLSARRQNARNDVDVWSHVEDIVAAASAKGGAAIEDGGEVIAKIYLGLVFCAVETGNLLRLYGNASSVIKGINDGCSPSELYRLVQKWASKRSTDLLAHVIVKWVVHQHFEVAATRSRGKEEKGRLRYVDGDFGLENTRQEPRVPNVTPDRLEQAVLLCKQAGLLAAGHKPSTYRLTRDGMKRLK